LTPTASPAGDEVAYLSDNGGHVNVWVAPKHGAARQITLEDDPAVTIGVPIWSPDGKWIAFVSSKGHSGLDFGVWLVKPDGSELPRQLVPKGFGVAWSEDGRSLYYVETASSVIKKIAAEGGEPETVRSEQARNVIGVHGTTVYFVAARALMDGRPEFEVRAAPLGTGPTRVIKTIPASRVASWQVINPALSPDGKWLAMPLTDGFTTNIWALSTDDGRWRQVTDFGDRAVFIARRISWSADGRSLIAAIGEGDADIVLLDGLIRKGSPF
jgi:Tol biopolymer transport system component